jgi:type VI secretion system secreted protein VgrG
MFAKLDVTLRGNRVIFNATKSVTISGGGSYTRWSAAGIVSGTLGKWTVHAKQRIEMVEPRSLPVVGPELPNADIGLMYDEEFLLKTQEGEILANMPYTVEMPDGKFMHGITNESGQTKRYFTDIAHTLKLHIGHV